MTNSVHRRLVRVAAVSVRAFEPTNSSKWLLLDRGGTRTDSGFVLDSPSSTSQELPAAVAEPRRRTARSPRLRLRKLTGSLLGRRPYLHLRCRRTIRSSVSAARCSRPNRSLRSVTSTINATTLVLLNNMPSFSSRFSSSNRSSRP